ncbi:hypothetical protein BH20ACT9_BH20ACT9_01730 [soil metagenome]
MDESSREWEAGTRRFVLAHLPGRPARVLEIGCGEGHLTVAMARAGHRVVGVDPIAPKGGIFRRTTFEAFEDAERFDCVVASLVLHHIPDLARALDKSVRMLRPGGQAIVVEFAWDRIDEATARWYHEHLPADDDRRSQAFLAPCCDRWARARLQGASEPFERYCGEWAQQEGLHDSATMLHELRARYALSSLEWGPYLASDLEGVTHADERARIGRGDVQATSFRLVGRPGAG